MFEVKDKKFFSSYWNIYPRANAIFLTKKNPIG